MRAKYEPQGITFLQINSNLPGSANSVSLPTVATQATKGIPVLVDETQLIGESLGLKRNGEVLIANPQGWKVTYRGGIGAVPTVLDSMLAGGAVKAAASEVAGCADRDAGARQEDRRTRRSRTRRRSRRC